MGSRVGMGPVLSHRPTPARASAHCPTRPLPSFASDVPPSTQVARFVAAALAKAGWTLACAAVVSALITTLGLENAFGNVHIVRGAQIVRGAGRDLAVWRGLDLMGILCVGLRAWSRLTGWRFESSSAHRESPANAGLSSLWASWRNISWQQLWQHRPPTVGPQFVRVRLGSADDRRSDARTRRAQLAAAVVEIRRSAGRPRDERHQRLPAVRNPADALALKPLTARCGRSADATGTGSRARSPSAPQVVARSMPTVRFPRRPSAVRARSPSAS
jgi:hypothetical protein